MMYIYITFSFVAIWLMSAWEHELVGEWGFWVSFLILGIMGLPILIAEYIIKKESATCDQQESGQTNHYNHQYNTVFEISQENLSSRRKAS